MVDQDGDNEASKDELLKAAKKMAEFYINIFDLNNDGVLSEKEFEGKSIDDILGLTVDDAIAFFEEHVQDKLVKKLSPLQKVGLGYVSLGQSSATLSGGEAQRIKLASFIGKGDHRDKILFIFDEPTTGLHFHDIKKLLTSFEALLEKGHSLIVVEHNIDLIKCADHVIDLGPEGGNKGGTLLGEGTPEELSKIKGSFTGNYLKKKLKSLLTNY